MFALAKLRIRVREPWVIWKVNITFGIINAMTSIEVEKEVIAKELHCVLFSYELIMFS